MNSQFGHYKRLGQLLSAGFLLSFLSACGGGSSDSLHDSNQISTPAATIQASAFVTKGPVSGASCELFLIESGQRIGAGTTVNGNVQFNNLPATATGPAHILCSGGSYQDETTGLSVTAPAMSALVKLQADGSYVVSALTEIAYRLAQQDLTNFETYNRQVAAKFGLSDDVSITQVKPTDVNTSPAAADPAGYYGAVLAALSHAAISDANGALDDRVDRQDPAQLEQQLEQLLDTIETTLASGQELTATNLDEAFSQLQHNNVPAQVARVVAARLGSTTDMTDQALIAQVTPLVVGDDITKLTTDSPFQTTAVTGGSGSGTLTYSSSVPSVATISTTGELTINGAGSTAIIITKGSDTTYLAQSAQYLLTVTKAAQAITIGQDDISASTANAGTTYPLNASLAADSGQTIIYTSGNNAVAAVSATGEVSIGNTAGTTLIQAAVTANAQYQAAQASIIVTVLEPAAGGLIAQSQALLVGDDITKFTTDDPFQTTTVTGGSGNGVLTYSSSVPSVATISTTTGQLSINGAGNTIITVTKGSDTTYLSQSAQYLLTVTKAAQTVTIGQGDISESTANAGTTYPLNATLAATSGQTIAYTSGNNAVAAVSATGEVTIGATAGTTLIHAAVTANAQYQAAQASIIVTVTEPDTVALIAQVTPLAVGDDITKSTTDDPFQTATVTGGSGSGALTYTSSVPAVATISNSGQLSIEGAGNTIITVTKGSDTTYLSQSAQYLLTVNKAAQTVNIAQGDISASTANAGTTYALNATLAADSGQSIVYLSDDDTVAAVSATGEVTIGATAGTTLIHAAVTANAQYQAAQATIIVTVTEPDTAGLIAQAELLVGPNITKFTTDSPFPTTTVTGGSGSGALTYSSSVPAVATISATTGQLSINGAGNTIITVTKGSDTTYLAQSAQYLLTVNKAAQTVNIGQDDISASTANAGTIYDLNATLAADSDQTITYTSGDEAVARVSATGEVTIGATAGTTLIHAAVTANAQYQAAQATIIVTVTEPNTVALIPQETPLVVGDDITKFTTDSPFPTTPVTGGSGNGALTYSSSVPSVAIISTTTGQLSINGAGSTIITVTKGSDTTYLAQSAQYLLTVNKAAQTVNIAQGDISASTANAGMTYALNASLAADSGQTIVYTSGDDTVAAVSTTGEVSIAGAAGTTLIQAAVSASDQYQAAQATIIVTVTEPNTVALIPQETPLVVGDDITKFTTDSPFQTTPVTGGSGNGALTYSSSVPSVATISTTTGELSINGAGSTIITVTKGSDATYLYLAQSAQYLLTVNKAAQTVNIAQSDISELTTSAGRTYALNATLTADSDQTIVYTSDNEAVARVSATGEITIGATAGTTLIHAAVIANDQYQAAQARIIVTVTEPDTVALIAQEMPLVVGDNITKSTTDDPFQTTEVTGGSGSGVLTYSSSVAAVATISTSGELTIEGAGNTIITVTKGSDTTYLAQSAQYLLTVNKAAQTVIIGRGDISESTDNAGTPYALNATLAADSDQTIVYTSDNEAVARVSATGEITIGATAGTTLIHAAVITNDQYQAAQARIIVTVTEPDTVGLIAQAELLVGDDIIRSTTDDPFPTVEVTGGSGNGVLTYSSSVAAVATISTSGELTIEGAGNTIITVTKGSDTTYLAQSAQYLLTVNKAAQTVNIAQGGISELTTSAGTIYDLNATLAADSDQTITYTSGDEAVARVSATGEVTIGATAGTTLIHAAVTANAQYQAAQATIIVTVTEPNTVALIPQETPLVVGDDITKFTTDSPFPTTPVTGGSGNGALTYSSSVPSVATISTTTGQLSIAGAGSTIITVTKGSDTTYLAQSAQYLLTVTKAAQAITIGQDDISELTTSAGTTYALNASLAADSGQSIVYTSGDDTVAAVSATGEVTIGATAGTTLIHAAVSADDQYQAAQATIIVTVTEPDTVALIDQAEALLVGDNITKFTTDVPFQTAEVTGGSGSGAVTYSSSVPAVATISNSGQLTIAGAGSTIITVTKGSDTTYLAQSAQYLLTVNKAAQTVNIGQDDISASTANAGTTYPLNATLAADSDQTIAYTSGDEAVARVSTTGEVTIGATAGTTLIHAAVTANAQYQAAQATIIVTVTEPDTVALIDQAEALLVGDDIIKFTTDSPFQTTPVTGGSGSGVLTYSSSVPGVATISASGELSIEGAGNTIITVTKGSDTTYLAQSAQYLLTVNKAAQTVIIGRGDISESTDNAGRTYDLNATLMANSGQTITYTSGNNAVAAVSATGEVTIGATAGTTLIHAAVSADDQYQAAQATIIVTVTEPDTVGLIAQAELLVGPDITKRTTDSPFQTTTVTGGSGSGALTYSSSVPDVATISNSGQLSIAGAGNTIITVTKGSDTTYLAQSAQYLLAVNKAAQTVNIGQDDISASTANAGTTYPLNASLAADSGQTITYTSGDEAVAAVSATGEVTIGATAGTTLIHAAVTANAQYQAAQATIIVTVTEPDTVALIDQETPLVVGDNITKFTTDVPFQTTPVTGGSGSGVLTYSSSVPAVATISTSGGELTIEGAGSTIITVTKGSDTTYLAQSAQYLLTVNKAAQTVNIAQDDISESTANAGSTYALNATLTAANSGQTITYTSGNNAVAAVSATGEVTIGATAGTTLIHAAVTANDQYQAAQATIIVTVTEPDTVALIPQETPLVVGDDITKFTTDSPFQTAEVTGGSGSGALTYSSSVPGVATISNSGQLTIEGAGSTIITVTKGSDTTYLAQSAQYLLTVTKAAQAITIGQDDISELTTSAGRTYALNASLTADSGQSIVYTSGDDTVAAVSATGEVTIVGAAGTTLIHAAVTANAQYQAAQATIIVTVTEPDTVALIDQAELLVGDDITKFTTDVPFQTAEVTGGSGSGVLTYSSSVAGVATINTSGELTIEGAGSTIITVTKGSDTTYLAQSAQYLLTVNKAAQTVTIGQDDISELTTSAGMTYDLNATLMAADSDQTIVYTSGDDTVAAVSATGEVTIGATAGTTLIHAAVTANAQYQAAQATIIVTVTEPDTVALIAQETPLVVGDNITKFTTDVPFQTTPVTGGSGSGVLTYSSSVPAVATISNSGQLSIEGAGSTIITVTKGSDTTYLAQSAQYLLTVTKAAQAITIGQDDISELTTSAGTTYALNATLAADSDQTITYTSGDEAVARVSATGEVTIGATAGTTLIQAAVTANNQYQAAQASIIVTVTEPDTVALIPQTVPLEVGGNITKSTTDDPFQTVTVTGGSGSGTLTYTSSVPSVATISTTGELTINGAGSTAIIITKGSDATYLAQSAQYLLTVNKAAQTVTIGQGDISESTDNAGRTYDLNATLMANSGQTITYTSGNNAVAAVSATGEVTIGATAGTTLIHAAVSADDQYQAAQATIIVTVTEPDTVGLIAQAELLVGPDITKRTTDSPFQTTTVTGGSGSGALTYSSSVPDVATISNSGQLSIAGAGNTIITVTKGSDTTYLAQSAQYLLAVNKAAQTVNIGQDDISASTANAGTTYPLNASLAADSGQTITYTSGDEAVAAVSATGEVTIGATAGTTLIHAAVTANAQYQAAQATIIVTVTEPDTVALIPQETPLVVGDNITKFTTDVPFQTAEVSGGSGSGAVTYSSSVLAVATISNSGQLSIAGAGSTIITVTKGSDTTYLAQSAQYLLTVNKAAQTVIIGRGDISESTDNAGRTYDLNATLMANSGQTITYTSGNNAVAAVSATGEVTIGATAGTTLIHAAVSADDQYQAAQATIIVTVTEPDTVALIAQETPLVVGDNITKFTTDVPFQTTPVTGGSGSGVLTYSSSVPAVATISTSGGQLTIAGAGSTIITVTKGSDTTYLAQSAQYLLTVNKAAQTVIIGRGDISESTDNAGRTYDLNATLMANSGQTITYTSGNNAVAAVSATGEVTIGATAGTTLIHAAVSADDQYQAAQATIIVTVTEPDTVGLIAQAELLVGPDITKRTTDDPFQTTPVTGGSGSGVLTYSSSVPSVATISTSGQLRIEGAGSTIITVTKGSDTTYLAQSAQYLLTVNKAAQTVNIGQDDISASTANAGTTYPLNATLAADSDQTIAYTSGDEAVARVSTTGEVTIGATAGSTLIHAAVSADDQYQAAQATIIVTVTEPDTVALIAQETPLVVGDNITKFTTDSPFQTTPVTGGSGSGVLTYSSSVAGVATINTSGELTIEGAGNTIITVTKGSDSTYLAQSAAYLLTVHKADVRSISFGEDVTKLASDADFSVIAIVSPPSPATASPVYSSSKESVAIVNAAGQVSITGPGITVITATVPANDTYAQAVASYVLFVAEVVSSFGIALDPAVDVPENQTYQATATVSGVYTNPIRYTLMGADDDLFQVDSSGEISLAAQNFEAPADADGNNRYDVTLVATDATNAGASIALSVTITDVLETASFSITGIPIINLSIDENTAYLSATPRIVGTPIGAVVYSIDTNYQDGALFAVNNNGQLALSERNFENPQDSGRNNTYWVRLVATDADNNRALLEVGVIIVDVDDETENFEVVLPPSVTVDEAVNEDNLYIGEIEIIEASGAPTTTYEYQLIGEDAHLFRAFKPLSRPVSIIVNRFRFDFENPQDTDLGGTNTYHFTLVTTSVVDGAEVFSPVVVTVNNLNDNAPVFADGDSVALDLPENSLAPSHIPFATDADGDELEYSIVEDANTEYQAFALANGRLFFRFAPDYENPDALDGPDNGLNVYEVKVSVSDGQHTATQTITINITDVTTETPQAVTGVTIAPRQPAGFIVGWTDVADADFYRVRVQPVDAELIVSNPFTTGADGAAIAVPLLRSEGSSFVVESCNQYGCTTSNPVNPTSANITGAIGYFKGIPRVAYTGLNYDGTTLVMGSADEVRIYNRSSPDAFNWSTNLIHNGLPGFVHGSVEFSADGHTFAVITGAAGVKYTSIFRQDDVGDWSFEDEIQTERLENSRVSFNNDGSLFAVVDDSTADAVDLYTPNSAGQWTKTSGVNLEPSTTVSIIERIPFDAAISADGQRLVILSNVYFSVSPSYPYYSLVQDGIILKLESGFEDMVVIDIMDYDTGTNSWVLTKRIETREFISDKRIGGVNESDYTLDMDANGTTIVLSHFNHTTGAAGVHEIVTFAEQIAGSNHPVIVDHLVLYGGAVFLFDYNDNTDSWKSYTVRASNLAFQRNFAHKGVRIAADGNSFIAAGTRDRHERGESTGLNGFQSQEDGDISNTASAAYEFRKDASGVWSQVNYIKGPTLTSAGVDGDTPGEFSGGSKSFGLSGDGKHFSVVSFRERSSDINTEATLGQGRYTTPTGTVRGVVYLY